MSKFTHLTGTGEAHMVDVSGKSDTLRVARAAATVKCGPQVITALRDETTPKGDVLAVSRVAGITAAKRVPELLPLAHVIAIHGVTIDFEITDETVEIRAEVRSVDRTGVEMEALTAATVAALSVVDMVKGLDRLVEITSAKVISKSGGRSGDWQRHQTK